MSAPSFLVCARADAPRVVRGTVFDRVCSKCSENVMTAPSGQAKLKETPGMLILCEVCFLNLPGGEYPMSLAADPEVILREVDTSMPNPYRNRN